MKVEISNGWLTADVRTTSQLSLLHNFFNKFKNEIFWINICFCFCSLVSLKAGRLINEILETKVALVLVCNDGVFEINHYWWQITTRRPIELPTMGVGLGRREGDCCHGWLEIVACSLWSPVSTVVSLEQSLSPVWAVRVQLFNLWVLPCPCCGPITFCRLIS